MQIVIDSSAILAVLLHEPEREALIATTATSVLIGPGSIPWEVGNALIAGCRRKRLTIEQVSAAWTSFEAIPMRFIDVDVLRALHLAAKYGLYAYDAYVLEAAASRRAPLLTLDRGLIQAAIRAGVTMVEI